MQDPKPVQLEYELKLRARISSEVLLRILSEIASGGHIDFMNASPVTQTILVADPIERLTVQEKELDAPSPIDHEEIKRLARKLSVRPAG